MERTIRTAARRERPFDNQPPFQALKAFQISGRCISRLPGANREPGTWNESHREEGVSDKFLTELESSSSRLKDLELAATEPKADPVVQYHLATDASKYCAGGFLFQLKEWPTGTEALAGMASASE
ncbi:hypothetical protein MMC07_001718 [Pseudocyphellaria aurata]|nr:hypothetical protein [Pseudocyphellaria aurata]